MDSAPSLARRHEAIGKTRRLAARTLSEVLQRGDGPLNEYTIHQAWWSALAREPQIMSEGWYQPPSTGISVLISEPPGHTRTNFRSLRDAVNQPSRQHALHRSSLLFAYASPIDRASAMIGDFQVTVYSGDDKAMRDHLATSLHVTAEIAAFAEPGMRLSELYRHAERLMTAKRVNNRTCSTTDRAGLPNIGHTIPWSHGDYDEAIWAAISTEDMSRVASTVRGAIRLITPRQELRISNEIAFTIEPLIMSADGIQATFHMIVGFLGGQKIIHWNFEEIFAISGMTNFLPLDPP